MPLRLKNYQYFPSIKNYILYNQLQKINTVRHHSPSTGISRDIFFETLFNSWGEKWRKI